MKKELNTGVLYGGRTSGRTYASFIKIYEYAKYNGYTDVNVHFIDPHLDKLEKENKQLKEQLECSQTNEETYRLEMLDITKILGLDENTLFEDVKKYASKLQYIIDELEKWLEDEIKQYDNVGLKFKKQGNFECASRSYDYLKQYQTMLSKLQELKGSDNNV